MPVFAAQGISGQGAAQLAREYADAAVIEYRSHNGR